MMSLKPRGARRRSIAEINVVPYIDVMLVLLVIFMVTTPMMTQGVKVTLPQADANVLANSEDTPVILTVTHEGLLYLNILANASKPCASQTVLEEVAAALHLTPKRLIMVRGDKQASYQQIMQAMVLLQQAGASNIGLESSGIQ
jgi:biopolymer transport protein TolR